MNLDFVPNTTQIPNIIFDKWMAILTPAEFKVLLWSFRKIYSHKQIMKNCNLSKKEIKKAYLSLINTHKLNIYLEGVKDE